MLEFIPEFLLVVFYTIVFILLLKKVSFFRNSGLRSNFLAAIFIFKVILAIAAWGIYTFYYTDRSTADMYKYFDDSKVMHDALKDHPTDYLKMLLNLEGDERYYIDQYYEKMDYWLIDYGNTSYTGTKTMIRFNAFVRLFSFGYFNVHAVFACFVSFIGFIGMYRFFRFFYSNQSLLLVVVIFFLPTIQFWTSTLLKESIIFFALGILLYSVTRIVQQKGYFSYLLFGVSILLLYLVKYYVLIAIAPGLFAFMLSIGKTNKRILLNYCLIAVVLFSAVGYSYVFFSSKNPLQYLSIKQHDFVRLAQGGVYLFNKQSVAYTEYKNKGDLIQSVKDTNIYFFKKGSNYRYWSRKNNFKDTTYVVNSQDSIAFRLKYILVPSGSLLSEEILKPTISSFISYLPEGIINATLRPFLWEVKNIFYLVPAVENLFLLLVTILAITYFRYDNRKLNLVLFCLLYSAVLFTLIAVTTPVIGAIIRYKVPVLIFTFVAIASFINFEKLSILTPKIRKLFIDKIYPLVFEIRENP